MSFVTRLDKIISRQKCGYNTPKEKLNFINENKIPFFTGRKSLSILQSLCKDLVQHVAATIY